MKCEHQTCGNGEHTWMHTKPWNRDRGLKKHPYCVNCGAIKNISSDQAKHLGYYSNKLGYIKKDLEDNGGKKLTTVQVRLIMKELHEAGLDDTYSITKTQQEDYFVETVRKYTSLTETHIREYL